MSDPISDNDDCTPVPGLPLAGCAVHTSPEWWSYDTGTPGDCAGPGDPPPALVALAQDVVALLPVAVAATACAGLRGTAETLDGLVVQARRALVVPS